MISIIVATAKGGVIGRHNGLPWKLPGEMAFFKRTTTGHPVIMGRKTYESIGRPLPERTNIVITRDPNSKFAGCTVATSLDDAIRIAEKSPGADEVFIIGGEAIYNLALPLANRVYLTRVNAKIKGDKFFKYDENDWTTVNTDQHFADEKNMYNYEFVVLERNP